MIDCSRGAEWRKWDLHIHTPGTAKADQFGANSWDEYIETLEKINDVAALGITDYFSIDNFNKVKAKQNDGKLRDKFIFPNIELRILPVTSTETPINLHVIFDPSETTLSILDREFFRNLKFQYKELNYACIRADLIQLGRVYTGNPTLDDDAAWKAGIGQFVVSFNDIKIVLEKECLAGKYIVGVSNSNKDGNSGIQHSSLAATREEIYRFSDFILSSNPKDREFFLGKGALSAEKVIEKYGSLKPCIVGSDAHSIGSVCVFPGGRCTWIKSDPTFEGLTQIILEPEERVFIGDQPPLFDRVKISRTRFITGITLSATTGYNGQLGKWFENIHIPFNKELVAIIGNKGSGKSAIADIVALCSCVIKDEESFTFLNKKKFCEKNGRIAQNFQGNLEWESGYKSGDIPLNSGTLPGEPGVKYLSQGQFERLTNEISTAEDFQIEIESVVFSHIPQAERLNATSFGELKEAKTLSVEHERLAFAPILKSTCQKLVLLEKKRNPQYRIELEQKLEKKEAELAALQDPDPVLDPNTDPERQKENTIVHQSMDAIRDQIKKIEAQIIEEDEKKKNLLIQKSAITDIIRDLEGENKRIEAFIQTNQIKLTQAGLDIQLGTLIDFTYQAKPLQDKILEISKSINDIQIVLGEIPANSDDHLFKPLNTSLASLQEELKTASAKLDGEQKAYQDYLSSIGLIEQERKRIIGTAQSLDTIEYYKCELDYIKQSLSTELDAALAACLSVAKDYFQKSSEVVSVYKDARNRLNAIIDQHADALTNYKISIDAGLVKNETFMSEFLGMISKNKSGTFNGNEASEVEFKKLTSDTDFDNWDSVQSLLKNLFNSLKSYKRNSAAVDAFIDDQVKDPQKLFEYLFSVAFLKPNYQLKQGEKTLEMLSPGERGALLLVFYLLLDKSDIPLIIDQPEDNLDNHSVATILVPFIRKAKTKRQIIMVTHNPNLAVVSDAEQIIYASIDKENGNRFSVESGSIENKQINSHIVNVLEGAMKAFNTRKSKYQTGFIQ